MTGYRRQEPAFCRGCGVPWTPGADACPRCGEAILRAPVAADDPYAIPRLRAALICGFVVIAVRWISLGLLDEGLVLAAGAPAIAALVAVACARWWFPASRTGVLRFAAHPVAWVLAVGAGIGAVWALNAPGSVELIGALAAPEVLAVFTGSGIAIAIAWAAIAVGEELLFRGYVFTAVRGVTGTRGASIASLVMYAMAAVDPVRIAVAGLTTFLRARTDSVGPAIAVRLAFGITTVIVLALG